MSLGRWLGVSALVACVVGCSDTRSSDNAGAGGSAGAVGSAGQASQAGSAGQGGSEMQVGGSAAGGESGGSGAASQAGSGASSSGGSVTAGSSGSASGGDAGEGGDAPTPACETTGACVAATCGSKECFDLDRCATQDVRYWSTPDHDRSWGMVLNDDDEPVVTGTTQFGGTFNDPSDLFVTQLSKTGEELWSFKLGTAAREYGIGLARDQDGFLYATGASEGDLDGHPNAGSRDVYVLKLSPTGELVWSLLFGSAGSDQGADIQLDPNGNILVVGAWNFTPDDTQQPFLARISPAGALLGNTQLGIAHGSAATLEIDAEGNAYVTGESTLPMSGVGDAFVRKVAPDGAVLWAADWGSTEDDWTNGSVLTDSGELYVVGTTSGAIGNNPAPGLGIGPCS